MMDPTEEYLAWLDWRRRETCVWFGLQRWGLTALVLWGVFKWLSDVSDWIAIPVAMVVLAVHFWAVKRADIRIAAQRPK